MRSSIRSPWTVWVFMISNSSGVSFPGLPRMASGMAILPTSWVMAARAMESISSGVRPFPISVWVSIYRVMLWMRRTCSPDSPLRNSMAAERDSIMPRLSSMICRAWRSSSDCCRSTTLPSRRRAWKSSTTEFTRRFTT